MRHTLVICIGNKARGDDGAGRRVAELLEEADRADLDIISTPQLDVVMAERVYESSRVIFADAERREAPGVRIDELLPDTANTNAHAVDPPGLLALASTLYGNAPGALMVSIAGPHMEHAEGLSETAEAASREAASRIIALLEAAG